MTHTHSQSHTHPHTHTHTHPRTPTHTLTHSTITDLKTMRNSEVTSDIFFDCFALKMAALCPFEASVTVYQSARRNIPGDLSLKQQLCDNLKFSKFNAPHFPPHPTSQVIATHSVIIKYFCGFGTIWPLLIDKVILGAFLGWNNASYRAGNTVHGICT
jgi:hypothetical protein